MKVNKKKRFAILAAAVLFLCLGAFPGFSEAPAFEVVCSVPLETNISRGGTRDAAGVWLEMIQGAGHTLDLAEFYLSGQKGEALEPVVAAVLAAARRGVRVRILCEKNMAGTYPETLQRFRGRRGIVVRLFDWRQLTGGVLHAKYFIVDGRDVYLGSQNFDWRSLAHIQETGLRIRAPFFAQGLQAIFAADWQFSGGDRGAYQRLAARPPLRFPAVSFLVASPARFNPPGVPGALATLLALIDGARERLTVQLLSYSLESEGGHEKFTAIDQALRRAARRGVRIRMLVADWNLRAPQVGDLQNLARLPNIEVKFAAIPAYSRGFIPYARVVHSKVMRVDDDISWVGTSNWGYDYFYRSRNVETVLRQPAIARVLDGIFLSLWNGPYVQRLDANKTYTPPRIK